jgi:hypothetical protein
VTVPWLVLAWFVYAAFSAVLGLWFSVTRRNGQTATLWTLAAVALLGGGHWVFWFLCFVPLGLGVGGADRVFYLLFGLTPPAALACMSFHGDKLYFRLGMVRVENFGSAYRGILIGMVVWGLAAVALWNITLARFRLLANRGRKQGRPASREARPTARP